MNYNCCQFIVLYKDFDLLFISTKTFVSDFHSLQIGKSLY